MNTDYKTARRFVLGLDTKIRNTVEAISPTTYAAALRAAKAMEGPDSSREPPSSLVGQKRRHDQTDRNELSYKHRDDPIDSAWIIGVNNRAVRTGQRVGPSVRIAARIIGVSVWLNLEPVFDVEKKGI